MIFKINVSLLPVKLYYFLNYGALASIIPYLPVFAKDLGLSAQEVAVTYGIAQGLMLINNPIVGFVTDKYRNHKLVLIILMVWQIAFILPLYYLPSIHSNSQISNNIVICNASNSLLPNEIFIAGVRRHCGPLKNKTESIMCTFSCGILPLTNQTKNIIHYKQTHHFIVEGNLTAKIVLQQEESTYVHWYLEDMMFSISGEQLCQNDTKILCNYHKCKKSNYTCMTSNDSLIEEVSFSWTYQFWIFLSFCICASLSLNSSKFLADTMTLLILRHKTKHYGRQRLLASLGWGLSCMLFGLANDLYSKKKLQIDYMIAFHSFAGIMVITIAVVAIYFEKTVPPKSRNIYKDIGRVLRIPEVVLFAIMTCVEGMCQAFLLTYLLWHMEDLKSTQLNLGLAVLVMCIGEIPFFFFSGKIIAKLGHFIVICIAFIAIALRMFLYSVIDDPWLFLPVELLNGVTFGLFYVAVISYVKTVAPPGTLATMQEIFGACYAGIGGFLGSFVGGMIFNTYGAITTFRIFAAGAAVFCCVFALIYVILWTCDLLLKPAKSETGNMPRSPANVQLLSSQKLLKNNHRKNNRGLETEI